MDECHHPFVVLTRGGAVESKHYGVAALCDDRGAIVRSWGGAPQSMIFPRSSMKPIQSLVLAELGLSLSPERWALTGASHDGEEMHTSAISSWLSELEATPGDLACGPAWPAHSATREDRIRAGLGAEKICHNCSGKHAGQLALCQHMDWPYQDYHQRRHPAQLAMIERFEALASEKFEWIGIDGCSLPAPRLSLEGFARALSYVARSAKLGEAAEPVIAGAIAHVPLTGGSKQWNRELVQAGRDAIYAKTGAEGCFSVMSRKTGYAMALKIWGGSKPASEVAIAGLIASCAAELGVEADAFWPLSERVERNAAGIETGALKFLPSPSM